jgi:hypothetical protein
MNVTIFSFMNVTTTLLLFRKNTTVLIFVYEYGPVLISPQAHIHYSLLFMNGAIILISIYEMWPNINFPSSVW